MTETATTQLAVGQGSAAGSDKRPTKLVNVQMKAERLFFDVFPKLIKKKSI
jgi:hypothetical protein